MLSKSSEQIYGVNHLAVLKSINQESSFTKMDIVRQTRLSLPTVISILADLMAEEFVIENGQGRSRGGRPPSIYRFNPRARYAIGVEAKLPLLAIGLVDLQQNLVDLVEYPFSEQATPDYVLQTLEQGISRLFAGSSTDLARLIGIGLGVPGFVKQDTGVWLSYFSNPNIKDVPLRQLLYSKFRVPVYLQNELNVCALAELTYGNLRPENDVIFVTCYEGMKASVVVDGRILAGYHGTFGAVGHFAVVENGPLCHCGSKGCLEMYASGRAFRQIIAAKVKKDPTLLALYDSLEPAEMFRRAAEGDRFCREIVEAAVPHMAYAFASLMRLTDIEHITLLGIYSGGGVYLQNLLNDNIAPHLPETTRKNLRVQLGSDFNSETLVVAAALPAIAGFFEGETWTT